MTYDVITLGETMLRLSPPNDLRIEQANQYEVYIGGSESNVAIGLARLGLEVAWISRMTDNPLGHTIVNGIRAHGVDTSHVVWTEEDRVGLYFYEAGKVPRSGMVIYDRANSAISKIRPAELPHNLFQAQQSKLLHLSGITLAIGENASQTIHEAAKLAKKAGFLLSFDVNYRSLLWSPEQAVNQCHDLASMADILFIPLRDAVSLYYTSDDPQEAAQILSERYPQAIIVLTLGAKGAFVKQGEETVHHEGFPAEEVGRLGGGDAFVAGFLYAYLTYSNITDALHWGTASAAYKYSIKGDVPLLDKEPIKALVDHRQANKLIR